MVRPLARPMMVRFTPPIFPHPAGAHPRLSEAARRPGRGGPHAAIRANPAVALTIDTEDFPAQTLTIRGRAEIDEVDGLAPDENRGRS